MTGPAEPQLMVELNGALGLGMVGQEAAGLPAHPAAGQEPSQA
jgi:hypothetical protein